MSVTREEVRNFLKKVRVQQDSKNSEKFVAKETGKGLSSNDYTTAEKTKLNGIKEGAQANVIESVEIDGTAQTISGKKVTLDLGAYAKKADFTKVMSYKGSVDSFAKLPTTDLTVGDVYNIKAAGGTDANGTAVKAGDDVAYNGTGWDVLGGTTDLSGYVAKETGKGLSTNDYTTTEKNQLKALYDERDEKFTDDDLAAIFADDTTE